MFLKIFSKSIVYLNDFPYLHKYLKNTLHSLDQVNLKEIQIKTIESILKPAPSVILCDEHVGRKNFLMIGIMNKLLNNTTSKELNEDDEEFFNNSIKEYEKNAKDTAKNLEKVNRKPRGAIVISNKFDFATQYYKICRRLDTKNLLRCVRLGTSFQSIAPTVEYIVKYLCYIRTKMKSQMTLINK